MSQVPADSPARRGRIDPTLLAVLSNRLDGIVREMTNTLLRAGRSTVVSVVRDFSCALITPAAELLASAEGLPVHVIGSELLAAAMHDRHHDLAPGDAFLHNDPYRGNSHAADHAILVPVFFAGEHVLTAVAKVHQADCGNSLPTTYMIGARDVYEEGALVFPCVRIQREYADVEDIVAICRQRIRVPEQWYGDYLAALGAARVAERRIAELLEQYGTATFRAFVDEWFDYSERRMRAAIASLPSGERRAGSTHDPYPALADGVEIRVAVRVDAERELVELDARDNPDNYPGGLNLSEATATAALVCGLFNSIGGDVPHNAGSLRRVVVRLREGCIVGIPRFPHSCSVATTDLADRLICAVQLAFAEWGDGLGLAEGCMGSGPQKAVVSGRDVRFGDRAFVNQLYIGNGGGPASAHADGWPTFGRPVAGGLLYHDSIEVDEQKYPLLVRECRLVPDSGGAGRRRGGLACRVRYTPIGAPIMLAYGLDGRVHPPRGVRGGGPGHPTEAWLASAGGERAEVPAYGEIEVVAGVLVGSISNGGGGYGDPFERPAELVLEDVAEGWVTEAAARRAYGVAVVRGSSGRPELDVDATRRLRRR